MERQWGELSEECKHRRRVSGVEVQGGYVYQEQRPWGAPSCFRRFPDVGLERRREEEEGGWRWRWVGEGRVAEKRMWWHQQQQQVKHRAAATEGLDAHWFLLSAVNTSRLVQDGVWQLTEWNGGNLTFVASTLLLLCVVTTTSRAHNTRPDVWLNDKKGSLKSVFFTDGSVFRPFLHYLHV